MPAEWVTPALVDEVLAECRKRDRRPGALPVRFMVYFRLALALVHQDSYDDVAENLVGAIAGMDDHIPNKASFTRARERLGPEVLEALFRRLAGPPAPAGLAGSVLPRDAHRRGGRVPAGRAGQHGQPAHVRRTEGLARIGGRISAGTGRDADRNRHPGLHRCAGGRIQRR
ncbi:transposase domain-containing protein [Streptomyces sp. TRM72054]|uniref:transposase domain-containing protein n=1 Tax=Streptomyces sp. TRM72054 TaxID=2870562 RepID=UPI0035ABB63A